MKPPVLIYRELWKGLDTVKRNIRLNGEAGYPYMQAYADLRDLITRIVPSNIRNGKVKE